jgi:LCP family protein required for cell wall assembly
MSKKTLVIVIVTLCAVTGLLYGGWYFNSLMDKPLGPSLKANPSKQTISESNQLSTPVQDHPSLKYQTPVQNQAPAQNQTSTQNQTPAQNQPSSQNQTLVQNQTTVQNPTPSPISGQNQAAQIPVLCGKTPVLTILLAGIDFRGDNYLYGLADVIRIVRVDFTTHQASVLTLDRNIWVEIPGISDHYGITHGLINQAYFFGVPAMGYYDGPGGGAGLLAATLKKNFDLDVDNYAVIDMGIFVKFIDALGGIDVVLPEPIDGTKQDPAWGYFIAGENHLDGARALILARIREGYTTLIRDRNQDLIIKAIFSKLSSPDIITKIPGLLKAFQNAGLTDLNPRQIESMICLMKKMDRADLTMRSLPDKYYVNGWIYDDYMKGNVNIWDIDFAIFRAYIGDFMNGQWPQE